MAFKVIIILDTEKTTSSIFLFNILNWLTFTKESLIKRTTLTFKRVNASYCTPSYFNSLLVRNSDVHSRETRYSKSTMSCPRYKRKTEGGKTFAVRTIIDWNSIDINIRNKTTVSSFKRNIYNKCLNDQKVDTRLEI